MTVTLVVTATGTPDEAASAYPATETTRATSVPFSVGAAVTAKVPVVVVLVLVSSTEAPVVVCR